MAAKAQSGATQIVLVGDGAGKEAGFKFAVLDDMAGALEVVRANLDGMPVEFERIKIPAGGGLAFEVPGDEGLKAESEIVGVILDHYALNAYWPDKFAGANKPPQCSALGGVTGIGEPGGACATCSLNLWGSEAHEAGAVGSERGKACRNLWRVYSLQCGEILPLLFTLPPTSLKPFNGFARRLTRGGRPFWAVVTRVTLAKATNVNGITYSQAAFARAADLQPAQALKAKEYAKQLRPYMRAVKVQGIDYNIGDSGNGHDAAGADGGATAPASSAVIDIDDPF